MLRTILLAGLAAGVLSIAAGAQQTQGSRLYPRPVPMPKPAPPVKEPTDPPAQTVTDARTHVTFHLPAGWNLSREDGEISTFRLDARSASGRDQLRAVANLAFNPYPRSTFAGALFYLSVIPHSKPAECLAQAQSKPNVALGSAPVADLSFSRGHDAHGTICTEARDTVYTAMRHGSCIRFDLAINSFCGGEVSGAQDLTEDQLTNIQERLEGILNSVRFTGK